jgi:hypothetical protein
MKTDRETSDDYVNTVLPDGFTWQMTPRWLFDKIWEPIPDEPVIDEPPPTSADFWLKDHPLEEQLDELAARLRERRRKKPSATVGCAVVVYEYGRAAAEIRRLRGLVREHERLDREQKDIIASQRNLSEQWQNKAEYYGTMVHDWAPALEAAGFSVYDYDATKEGGVARGVKQAIEALATDRDWWKSQFLGPVEQKDPVPESPPSAPTPSVSHNELDRVADLLSVFADETDAAVTTESSSIKRGQYILESAAYRAVALRLRNTVLTSQ